MTAPATPAPAPLPAVRPLGFAYVLSGLIALIMAATSLLGLLNAAGIYPAQKLIQTFVPNDAVNLCLGMPVLLGAMWLAGRGRWLGLLLWPGAIFYVLYTYLTYVFGIPFGPAFLLHLALVTLSAYTLTGLVASLDAGAVQRRLSGTVPGRLGGGVLTAFGALFFLRAVGVAANALLSRTPLSTLDLAPLVADFVVTPAWVVGGVLLWRRQALGYVAGPGLLFQASLLFVALIGVMLLQPLLTKAALAPVDLLVIFVMGLFCFVPFALFVRGIKGQAAGA